MEIGLVGLGSTGLGIARRLVAAGHTVFAYDEIEKRVVAAEAAGTKNLSSIEELVRMRGPRTVWMRLPAGDAVESVLDYLSALLTEDDIVIDSSFSRPQDSMARQQKLLRRGIHVIDVGVLGGPAAAAAGFCLLLGGDAEPCNTAEPFLQAVAAPRGFARVGGPGAGHLARLIFAAIEDGASPDAPLALKNFRGAGGELDLQVAAGLWCRSAVSDPDFLGKAKKFFGEGSEVTAAIAAALHSAG